MRNTFKSKLALISSAIPMVFVVPVTPVQAQEDLELLSQAIDMCQLSPGYSALGYPNVDICIEGVYLELLNGPRDIEREPFVPNGRPPQLLNVARI